LASSHHQPDNDFRTDAIAEMPSIDIISEVTELWLLATLFEKLAVCEKDMAEVGGVS